MYIKAPISERFFKKITKTKSCWIWNGAKAGKGYGVISIGGHCGKLLYAHRVSWELHFYKIPKKIFVLHKCDNAYCVNPNHLFLGTAKDNVQDMITKGRNNFIGLKKTPCGEKHWNKKITHRNVNEIREKYFNKENNIMELSKIYKVSFQQISKIIRNERWKI